MFASRGSKRDGRWSLRSPPTTNTRRVVLGPNGASRSSAPRIAARAGAIAAPSRCRPGHRHARQGRERRADRRRARRQPPEYRRSYRRLTQADPRARQGHAPRLERRARTRRASSNRRWRYPSPVNESHPRHRLDARRHRHQHLADDTMSSADENRDYGHFRCGSRPSSRRGFNAAVAGATLAACTQGTRRRVLEEDRATRRLVCRSPSSVLGRRRSRSIRTRAATSPEWRRASQTDGHSSPSPPIGPRASSPSAREQADPLDLRFPAAASEDALYHVQYASPGAPSLARRDRRRSPPRDRIAHEA